VTYLILEYSHDIFLVLEIILVSLETQCSFTLASSLDRGVVATLTQANSHLTKQLEENSSELRELRALLDKERHEKRGPRRFKPSTSNYCWTHGYKVGSTHTSLTYTLLKLSHKTEATRADNMGGSQANRE
jgi:hypothetical protein